VPYIGQDLQVAFPSYTNIDDISGSFDGVTTSFPLTVGGVAPVPAPLGSNQCLISVDGVVQRPDDTGTEGFRLSGGNIIFSSAPSIADDFFGIILAGADYVNVGANFPDGTLGAPSITFDQDNDTGYYRSGSGAVSFASNGVAAGTWSSAGVTAPALIPTGSSVPANGVYLPAANTVGVATNGTGRLFVDANGTVRVNSAIQATSNGGLNVEVTSNGSSSAPFTLLNRGTSNDTGVFLTYRGLSSASAETDYAYMQMLATDTSSRQGAIAFWTANGGSVTERLRITSAGLVGIGNSSPGAKLDVSGDAIFDGGGTQFPIQFANAFTPNVQRADLFFSANATSNNALRVGTIASNGGVTLQGTRQSDSSQKVNLVLNPDGGSVGIGTTSPSSLLEISSSSDPQFVISNTSNSISAGDGIGTIDYRAGSSNTVVARMGATADSANEDGAHIVFENRTGGGAFSEKVRIDSSGRLLVGTSSTSASFSTLLQNASGDSFGILGLAANTATPADNSPLGDIRWSDSGHTLAAMIRCKRDGGTWSGSSKPTRLEFSTTADGASSPTERMTVTRNGYVLASNTGSYAHNDCHLLQLSNGSCGLRVYNSRNTSGDLCLYLRLGVNTNNTASKYIVGDTDNTGDRFHVYGNGNIVNVNNSYGALSDIKLKENIVDANSQWSDLKALQVRNYNFKEGQIHTQIGLIAQEVELVSPGLVTESPDQDREGNNLGTVTKSVNYSVLYMKAVKALQEAMERIETLEARLTAAGIE
jgi:hypothetical protein